MREPGPMQPWHTRAIASALLILCFGPFALAQEKQSAQQEQPAQAKEKEGTALRRIEWFYKQRAFPLGFIPAGARQKALEQLDLMLREVPERTAALAAAEGNVPAPEPSTSNWTLIGPQPINALFFSPFTSGRVTALAVDPTNSQIVYAGAAQGGIWKTTDGGASWTPLADGEASLAIGSLAIDPSPSSCSPPPCKTIYAGTGEENFAFDNYYGAGILKSTNGGATWTHLGTPPGAPFVGPSGGPISARNGGARIGSLAVSPNGQIVLAAVQGSSLIPSGIYRSTDGGVSWSLVRGGAPGTEVVFHPTDNSIAYAALGNVLGATANGVYKSTDGGVTWAPANGTGSNVLPSGSATGRIEIAIAPSNPAILYAGIQDPTSAKFGAMLGFFKTTDGGQNWMNLTNTTPDYCKPQCWYDNVVRVHPQDPNSVYAGGAAGPTNTSTLFRTTNGGNTWTNISRGVPSGIRLHVDHHALGFSADGSKLYVGNDGGVWVNVGTLSSTSSPDWTNLNGPNGPGGLAITQLYPGHSIHPSNPLISFGGSQDNGTVRFSGDFAWDELNVCGDGGWTAIDPSVPSTVYAACQDIDINKSVQNGGVNTFASAVNGIDLTDRNNFIAPLVVDPTNSQRLYFGTFRIWQTTDGAITWTPISPDLTSGGNNALTTIAVAQVPPGNPSVVYGGSEDGRVHAAFNVAPGSATFSDVTTGLPTRAVTQIGVDPSDSTGKTAYVTFSGFTFGGDTQGHVFKTINGGIASTDISCGGPSCAAPGPGALPNTPVNDLVIDPDDPTHNTLYVATDIGVFQTSNANLGSATTWSPMFPASPGTPGLPRVAVLSLKLHEPSRTLRAATHGRSVWDLQLPNLSGSTFNLSSISPTTVSAGSGDFMLKVNGKGFTQAPLSVVKWNGAAQPTTFVTANQLTASIPASLVASAGTAQVTVDQSGSGPISNALVFTITGSSPSLSSIAPTSAAAGAADTTLTLTGTDFVTGSKVLWNGSPLPTTNFVNSNQLTTTLPQILLAFGGVNTVRVVNPPPGGGPSNGRTFTVNQMTPPPNDLFANAITVTTSNFTNTVDNFAATTEAIDPRPSCAASSSNPRTKTVWYKFTPESSGSVTADTVGSPYDTILTVLTGVPGAFNEAACSDDIIDGVVQQSRLMFNVNASTTYFFMISPFDPLEENGLGLGGKTVFNLSSSVAPAALVASPNSAAVNPGQSASYAIAVMAGSPPFSNPVTLSVTVCPTAISCSLSSTSAMVGGNVQFTITTTSRSAVPGVPSSRPRPLPVVWPAILALALAAAALAARASRQRRWAIYAPLAALLLLLALYVGGCGGGGGGGSPPPPSGTPAGSYSITVTGTSGSVSHSTTVTLNVN